MTGSLQTKNGKYYIVLNTTLNGKRKLKWIATGLDVKGNKRKAEQLLRDKLHEYDQAPETIKSDILFSDYIRLWLKIAQRRVDDTTFQGYEQTANAQVIPYFEHSGLKLSEITLNVLQAYFDEKLLHGRQAKGTGTLSPTTLRQFKNIINQTLNEAVKNGLISSNPCQFVELPHKQRYESTFYSAEQLKALFDAVKDDPLYPLIKITALYGLRRSEVLGLKWDSIDFTGKRLTIRHTVVRITRTVEKDKTKNNSSHRTFPLTPEAEAIFRAAQAADIENRRLCGNEYKQNGYVFKWPDGTPFSPDYVSSHFALLLKRHGLPHLRFHELRHSCASLLLNQGYTLKDVQEYMGHSDIQMTANIYGHLDVARKQALSDGIAASLFR